MHCAINNDLPRLRRKFLRLYNLYNYMPSAFLLCRGTSRPYNKKSPTDLPDFFVYKSIVYSSSSWLHLQSRLRSPYALSIFAT